MLRHHLSRASRDPGRSALQAAPLRNLCVRRLPSLPRASRGLGRGAGACPELLRALDSSSLGLTLNFQLSTFNRVSSLSPSSPHLCALCVLCGESSSSFRSSLIPRHSPLATNSFIIRTSETPLPQLLYNPHLRVHLGTAGNKGLITPLESALTKNSPVSRLESALTKRWGWGSFLPLRNSPHATCHYLLCSSPFFSHYSKLFCAFLRLAKTQPFCFHAIPNSLRKTPGVGVEAGLRTSQHKAFHVPAFPLLSTLNCRLLTASEGLRTVAVVRRRSDSHAPKLIVVILLMKNVPLFAAFQNFLFLRGDALADFQLNLFFFSQNRGQNLHDLLADGVAVLDEFHVIALTKHFRNLVREADDFFAAQAHRFSNPSNQLEFDRMNRMLPLPPRPSAASRSAQRQLAVSRQLLLHFLVHFLIRDARAAHLVLVIDQDLPHFLVEPVLDGKLFLHALADAVGHRF